MASRRNLCLVSPSSLAHAGFWWWLATAAEFEYSNIYGVVRAWRIRTRYRQLANMMPNALPKAAERTTVEIDGALHPIKMPHNADELEFLKELERLQAEAGRIRAEINALSV